MVNKINRNFRLTIQTATQASSYYDPNLINNSNLRLNPVDKNIANDKPLPKNGANSLVIELPFTAEIDISNLLSVDGNQASIKIYGLNETSRKQLFQNKWNIPRLEGLQYEYKKVILEVGYGKNIYPIFDGVLTWGYSVRENVDWITNLTCISSAIGVYNTFINKTYNAGIKKIEVVNDIISQMSRYGDLTKGVITNSLNEPFTSPVSMIGESYNILTQFGVDVFIDMGKLNALQVNEAIGPISIPKLNIVNNLINKLDLQVPLINADSGLIGTPILNNDGYITLNMIFEPTVKVGSLVNLKSITASGFNGYYKVMGIQHKGVISSSKEGELITTLKMWTGGSLINNFNIISQ